MSETKTGWTWTQSEAIAFCKRIRPIAEKHGGFVALTGGALYEEGERKDVDIIIYRSNDEDPVNFEAFFDDLYQQLGITQGVNYGWCKKAYTREGARIDFFNPFEGGQHMSAED